MEGGVVVRGREGGVGGGKREGGTVGRGGGQRLERWCGQRAAVRCVMDPGGKLWVQG